MHPFTIWHDSGGRRGTREELGGGEEWSVCVSFENG